MVKNILTKLAGNPYERELARFQQVVAQVAGLEAHFESLADADLSATTDALRARLWARCR